MNVLWSFSIAKYIIALIKYMLEKFEEQSWVVGVLKNAMCDVYKTMFHTSIFSVNISCETFTYFIYTKLQHLTPLKHLLFTVCNRIYRYILTDATFIMFFFILFNHLISLNFFFLSTNTQSLNTNSYNLCALLHNRSCC